jgi:hypothetical protein
LYMNLHVFVFINLSYLVLFDVCDVHVLVIHEK